jgi:hypothetical protein
MGATKKDIDGLNAIRPEDHRPPNWRPEWEDQGPLGKPLSSLTPEQLAARSDRRAGQPQMDYSRQKEDLKFRGYPGQAGNIVSGERMPYGGESVGPMVQQDTANAQTANARPGVGGRLRRFKWQR